ncbi:phenazine biosynthesis-like protein [Aspergillus nomiae NRRL 13137]|uniref:Phenazine biosynthesis-like protein n=1 Tax=Aspergillus nomiae NRRL (strain ATCC 15546 / NRRL 13137 / CBS 260.88 / M93) TaxID=1509407 RepID=A0A0L1J1E4_ASPN3|nr:phenazine biosynthesis-like protein [Aspergillus nomiae NRRL 13137]KNG85562.1 phenazine biosynthesis-like protein [Aspergillus nomiae NRRL 13137]
MATHLNFVTLDVFTTTPFKGNPLGIVHLSPEHPLSQAQKQTIAREFNLSESVFIHDVDPSNDSDPHTRRIDIFTTNKELPFAGHPTIGTASYLQAQGINKLITKAGPIAIHSDAEGLVSASIPHDTHLNSKVLGDIESTLRADKLHPTSEIRSAELQAPIFSIVKGMTFALVSLPSLDLLSQVYPGAFPCAVSDLVDVEWSETFIGRYYYVLMGTSVSDAGVRTVQLRTRMMEDQMEDPATGSAACALTSYLALHEYSETSIQFQVTQGVEMGRQSDIAVEVRVDVGEDGVRKVREVHLGGKARQIMKGSILVPDF